MEHIEPSQVRSPVYPPLKMPFSSLRASESVRVLLGFLCIGNLCTVLALGLWPFHAASNDVYWLEDRNGLRFGKFGSIMTAASFIVGNPQASEASLELWVEPVDIWRSGTLLAFQSSSNQYPFSLHQFRKDLVVRVGFPGGRHDQKFSELNVRGVFDKPRPVLLTLTCGPQGVCIYVNSAIVATSESFPLTAQDFSGQLVLADSPGQTNSWTGQIFGAAIYRRQLSPTQAFSNHVAWKQTGQPAITPDAALYLFDERAGNVVRNKVDPRLNLTISHIYRVLNKIFLEPFWTEYQTSWNYWGAGIKNVVGFIPFGFCFYAYFFLCATFKRATALTVALGTAASLVIEVLQGLLPTRESGTTDLITNTFGTWIGVLTYRILAPALVRFLPATNLFEK
jgi:VanZ family protein